METLFGTYFSWNAVFNGLQLSTAANTAAGNLTGSTKCPREKLLQIVLKTDTLCRYDEA